MIVTAWNNGRHHATGAGFGLKIRREDRDRYFKRTWKSVTIVLPDESEVGNLNIDKRSFWSDSCRELINSDIGRWLLASGHAPWAPGQPPQFRLEPNGERRFRLSVPH